jgi:phospholipid-binding lipoprotein MlaA
VRPSIIRALLAVMTTVLGACATTMPPDVGRNPADPWERYNRNMFEINDALDRAILKPIAQGYAAVVPQPVRTCISNFFANIDDVPTALNNLLQGKPVDTVSDLSRVLLNTTVGIGGCFDVAGKMGITKHEEDFGQTLGRWGSASGPYFVIPLFGPSTVRDAFGRVVDGYTWPPTYLQEPRDRNSLFLAKQIDFRANLLPAERSIEGIGIDRYQFIRDVYLQRRRNLVSDGAEPEEPAKPPSYEDPEDEPDKKAKPEGDKPAASPAATPEPPAPSGGPPAQPK